ncbi:MAG: hypothetical protein HYW85_07185, partial [Deltaproteobacteria bacterium]|nr:hypothetical protein [Deltaproteobacteria bacterium]
LNFFDVLDRTQNHISSQRLTQGYITTKSYPTSENINQFETMLGDYQYGLVSKYYGGFNQPSRLMHEVLDQEGFGAPYEVEENPNSETNIIELLLRQKAHLTWLATQTQDREKQAFLNLKAIETLLQIEGTLQYLKKPFQEAPDPQTEELLTQAFSSRH